MATVSATFVFFDAFRQELGRAGHQLETDAIKAYLSNDAPVVATDAAKADVVEIATGNGYSGGVDIAATFSQTSGVATFAGVTFTITATGDVGPFRYLVVYNSTPAGGKLIGYLDWGSAITVRNGETFVYPTGTIFTIP